MPISKGRERKLTAADYRDLAEFRVVLRRFLAFSEDAARNAGLSPQQHQALLAVKGFEADGPTTIGDLANRLAIKHHSAVGLVDRLEHAGLLARHAGDGDRRRVTLMLTRKGEAVLARLTAANRDELRHLTPAMTTFFAKLER